MLRKTELDDVGDDSRLKANNTETTFVENVPVDIKANSLSSSFEDTSNNNYIHFKEEEKTLMTSLDSSSVNQDNNKICKTYKINFETTSLVSNRVPKCFYVLFADIRSFIFFMCLIVMLTNALSVGYRNSVITTIEKRFEFSSMSSGILSGFLEIGSLITTLIMSYFFSNSHIPKCIAVSSLFCAVGSIMYSLPHFITESYENNLSLNSTANNFLCKMDESIKQKVEIVKNSPESVVSFLEKLDIKSDCLLKPTNVGPFLILALANILIGSSSAPLYTLGTTYIDNHVDKDDSSVYLAFIYSMLAFGPLVGYLVGAGFLQFYVDTFRQTVQNFQDLIPGDSNWVGAWYAGFIMFGILIFFTSQLFSLKLIQG
ncbi:unnamed protein product [Brachionus calyciflorus]|uniref:Uncharacterized protein n=1 Tax=Brachionus calyciflorus TaxID=104777 RepID=A0A813Y254_9BILA|nr:unnamed protein product [Brachionus calyciflorus]